MERTITNELKRGELVKMIREMKPGDSIRFSLAKLDSVRHIAYNRLAVEKSEGAKWTVVADIPGKATIITRVS